MRTSCALHIAAGVPATLAARRLRALVPIAEVRPSLTQLCMTIDREYEKRLSGLTNGGAAHALQGGLKGLEKESLRVKSDGRISLTPHPVALGSALTNETITTDYSEALIELVTPPLHQSWELV